MLVLGESPLRNKLCLRFLMFLNPCGAISVIEDCFTFEVEVTLKTSFTRVLMVGDVEVVRVVAYHTTDQTIGPLINFNFLIQRFKSRQILI